MAWTAKTAKPRLFSTYLDVLTKAEEIKTTIADFAESSVTGIIMEQPHIEQLIYESDNLIRNYLRKYYTEANFRTTPWVTAPLPHPDNDNMTKILQSSQQSPSANGRALFPKPSYSSLHKIQVFI